MSGKKPLAHERKSSKDFAETIANWLSVIQQNIIFLQARALVDRPFWYAGGLHFECLQCGRCCAGPSSGFIWVTRPEIKLIADYLKIKPGELRRKFLRRIGLRTSIIESCVTRDCAFLQDSCGQKICIIYPVRPRQCRSWPFWAANIESAEAWNQAAVRCPGVNRGRLHSVEEIGMLKDR